jgi:multicomponent Na+:H+ antiporter subunit A
MVLVLALASMAGLALVAPILARFLGRNAGFVLAAGFIGVAVLLGTAGPAVLAGETPTVSWPWLPRFGVSLTLRLDGLTALFCLLVLGVGALILGYCPRYLRPEHRHASIYFQLTAFGGGMLGLVLAGDLVLLYVFWELTSVLSFFLIGAVGARGNAPALRALLVTTMGGLALLTAIVLVAVRLGTTDLATVLAARDQLLGVGVGDAVAALVILAAFTKSAQAPFSFWLPGAMVAITPVSAYLHAATMVKAGIYLLLRFTTVYAGQPGWSLTLLAVGLVTAIVGALRALREHDLKSLLAYSTVSQLGLLVAAIGVGTTVALAAAVLHTFAHALFKATLFMLVGIIDREAGSRDIRQISGLRRVMPVTATLTGLAGLSLAGVAPMIGFVSKESLFQGFASATVFPGAGAAAAALAVLASALTFAYGVRLLYGAFAGPTMQRTLYEPSWLFLAPAAIAAVASAALGPGVVVLNPLMRRAIRDVEPWGTPPSFHLWHGFSPELVLSGVTLALGSALFLARGRVDRILRRLPEDRGAQRFEAFYSALVRLGTAVGRPDHRPSTWPYLARPVAGLVLLAATGLGVATGLPAAYPRSRPLDWGLVVLLVAAVSGVLLMRTTLGSVAALGTVGLLVTTWFITAGAPDVALTLLLVEILTAVVAAFALRGLPARLAPVHRSGALSAAGLAGLAGLAAAAGTFALTGRRDPSAAGEYYLDVAEEATGGRNVVNTILVDFRGLDTLGEISVLASVALGLTLLFASARPAAGRLAPYEPLLGPAQRLLAPIIVALALYLLLRGHDAPGGGFIAALVASMAVALGALSGGGRFRVARGLRPAPLIATGLLICASVGLAVMAAGYPFLTPVKGPFGLSTSLLFDTGVFLLVLGVMVTAINRFSLTEGYSP